MACAKDSLILHRQRYNQGAVRSGKVYYKPARTRLQPWPGGCVKKYWCELRRESSYHPRQLALVEIPKCSQEEAETIPLENVFKVTLMEELAKGKSLFQIMTSNGKFTLGTDSLEESEKWICTLNKELFGPPKWNVVYEYRVKVLKNYQGDMSYGSYLLKVYNDEIKLFTPNGLIPTKFKCVLGDIFRVKHHIFGELHDCVTISIKNAVTNNKEIDILILNTKSASDVEKVITYRKRHLGLQNELDDKMISDNESSVAVKNVDELQMKLQRVSITSDTDFAASNPLPLAHQQVSQNNSPREEILNSDTVDNSDNASEPAESRRIRSLPRIYVVTVNPSLDDEDGEIWNNSFDLRAPKRKKKLRIKETKTLPLSHGMPSTQALEDVEISEQDNNPDINEISSTSDGQLQTTLIYESVYHTIPRLKDANAILSGHKTMESQNQGYDKLDDDDDDDDDDGYDYADCDDIADDDYVINKIQPIKQETYLQVLHPGKESAFTFVPHSVKKIFK